MPPCAPVRAEICRRMPAASGEYRQQPRKPCRQGSPQSDVTDTLSSAWGGTYVNDFIDRGRVKKVYIRGDSDYRAVPSDLNKWYVRGSDSTMTPFSAFATTRWEYGPESWCATTARRRMKFRARTPVVPVPVRR